MRSASLAAAFLVLLLPALSAAGGAAVAGMEAGRPGSGELPLLANISLPERTVTAQVWYERGFASTTGGRYADAEAAYRNALAADPSHLNSWYYLGDALFRLGRYGEALLAFRNATAVDPDFVDAYFYESRVYAELGMGREEKEALGKGLDAADRRGGGGEAGTPGTGEAAAQPVAPVISLLGAGFAAVLLGYRRRNRGS